MMPESPADALALDLRHLWHPFTQMQEWIANGEDQLVIVEGDGPLLRDQHGRTYFDGNCSIWTNLHGHRQPQLDAALRAQLDKVAHSSFLGLSNDVAPRLARELLSWMAGGPDAPPGTRRVFLSDDGSTAIEAGLKMIHQARAQRDEPERQVYLSLGAGYHGDTVGAMSLGHSTLFHATYRTLLFESREVPSPSCYRCPHNQAPPQRGVEARVSRRCGWECLQQVERTLDELGPRASAFVLEPRVQGAGSMTMHPEGYLKGVADLCHDRGVWLMLDEVFTGFGRTGEMFAFQKEGVEPDVVALAKGLTGGYLPLAATVATEEIFTAFLGDYTEFKTFFHGHSYCGNQLGSAVARANLALFAEQNILATIAHLGQRLDELLQRFWSHPHTGDIRREGVICALEFVADFDTREPFPIAARIGHRICQAARAHGLLTRPIGDVVLLLPPYCATDEQLVNAVAALWQALLEVLPMSGEAER